MANNRYNVGRARAQIRTAQNQEFSLETDLSGTKAPVQASKNILKLA